MSHKLLIVDDNRGCADMYQMRFERDDWEVKVVYSAEAALDLLHSDYRPELILLDIMLPKMQGDELLDIIREDESLKQIKVIILTALNLSSGDETKISDKADGYITKISITPKQLVEQATKVVEGWAGVLQLCFEAGSRQASDNVQMSKQALPERVCEAYDICTTELVLLPFSGQAFKTNKRLSRNEIVAQWVEKSEPVYAYSSTIFDKYILPM